MLENTCILSIIVPVYNVEKYLRDCLDSLLMQDLSENEYEIICVNDGSTDSSPAILDEYAEKHANVRVIHKQNGGVSSARNRGLVEAIGEYVWFVDSDDCIASNCLKYLKSLIEEYTPHFIKFGYRLTECDFDYRQAIFDQAACCLTLHERFTSRPALCGNIMRKDTIDALDLHFRQDLKYGEDTLFMVQWFMKTEGNWIELDSPLYFYRQVPSSSMHTLSEQALNKRHHDYIVFWNLTKAHLFSNDEKARCVESAVYWTRFALLGVLPQTGRDFKKEIVYLREIEIFPAKIYWKRVRSAQTYKEKIVVFIKSVIFHFVPLYRIYYHISQKKHARSSRKKS